MNTLILVPDQFIDDRTATLNARQFSHIKNVLKLNPGDTVKTGKLNGSMGIATYAMQDGVGLVKDIDLHASAPSSLPLTLILAMPRPQMLKRILQTIACFGVERLVLIQSNRVEKSFWQSPSAQPEAIQENLLLGLEQANATQLPDVRMYTRFKPFIEDSCDTLTENTKKFVLHPGPYDFLPSGSLTQSTSIAIGPEGGFTDFEMTRWIARGFQPMQLGDRILRVETAVTAALGRCIG